MAFQNGAQICIQTPPGYLGFLGLVTYKVGMSSIATYSLSLTLRGGQVWLLAETPNDTRMACIINNNCY